jgi:hypothetical protein
MMKHDLEFPLHGKTGDLEAWLPGEFFLHDLFSFFYAHASDRDILLQSFVPFSDYSYTRLLNAIVQRVPAGAPAQ